jgi:hypothetical protein
MFFRMVIYGVLFYVVWKVVQSLGGRMQRPAPPRDDRRKQPGSPKDLSNIQDAEFEDITPKKEPGGPKATP